MIVRCIINDLSQISDHELRNRLEQSIHIQGQIDGLVLGNEYFVHAINLWEDDGWRYYLDTTNSDYPHPYPAELFLITCNSIPANWQIEIKEVRKKLKIVQIAFKEWIDDRLFFEKLLDRDPEKIAIYRKYHEAGQKALLRMIVKTEQDRRLIVQIRHKFSMFENGLLPLSQMTADIRLLHDTISHLEQNWDKKFSANLEILGLYCIGKEVAKNSDFNVDEKILIEKTLKTLKELIDEGLSNYVKLPNTAITGIAQSIDNEWFACPSCSNTWESPSQDAMVICPHCDITLHNPRYKEK